MQFRFSQGGFKNYRLSKIHGFTLVELLVIIAILAILTVVGFLLLGNTTTTARDSQRIANIRQLHDATRLQAASLHTLPMPYQAVPISIGGGSGTIDLTISGATSQYAVFVDGSTQLSTLTGSRLLALARDGGVDTLLAGGTLSGTVSNQNLGWQGYADASIAGSLNYSDTVDPQDQALFTYRLGQNRDRSQFLAYLENPEYENQTPLLWRGLSDDVYADATDYTKRYPYVWGDRLGIVLDKGSNAPVQQGLTAPIENTGSTSSGNIVDTSGMMIDVGYGHVCLLQADGDVLCWGENGDGQTDVPSSLVDVIQISTGDSHSCALQSDGVVACWGNDHEAGYTIGVQDFSPYPGYSEGLYLAISGPSDVVQISAGGSHTCALKSNGTVECAGADWDGQSTPPSGLANVVQISAGGYHTCALKSDGTVECWGSNDNGQIDIPLSLSNITQVSAGKYHTCALKSDATVECWGINIEGENPAAYVPPGLTNVTQISSDSSYNCALKSNGSVECWGEYWNSDGWSVSSNYVPPDLSNVVQISAGSEYTCVIKSDSSVVCWGLFGYLPVPEELQNFPVILNSVVFDDHRLTTGNNFTCAITSTGGVECWGSNDVGQLDIPVGLDSVIEVNAGYGFVCALKSDGSVVCWGDPWGGQTDVPVGLSSIVQLSVGYNNVCALKPDGTVVCWGDNSAGQTTVPSGLNHIVQVATGWNFACALKDTGRMVCWGNSAPPIPPSDIGTVKQISAGDGHMCAVKTDDSVVCWGSNSDLSSTSDVAHVSAGEYYSCLAHVDGSVECGGNNGDGQIDVPMTLSGVTEISTSMGGSHTCALKSDNTIECWGRDVDGQTTVPLNFGGVTLGPISGVVFDETRMSAGAYFTCALKSDATVECWGKNDADQLTIPSGLSNVTQITSGLAHTCALKSDGTVECWGSNNDNQLNITSGLSDVVQISAGGSHTCALKSDGSVVCWGRDVDTESSVPNDLGLIAEITSGSNYTCALGQDRSIRCWGSNDHYVLDVPTNVTGVTQISAGYNHMCALKDSGRMICWGDLSDTVTNVSHIFAANGYSCVLKIDNSVECFGGPSGTPIPSLSDIVAVGAGSTHACSLDNTNQISCWGSNWYGESDIPVDLGGIPPATPLNLVGPVFDDRTITSGHTHTCAVTQDATVVCWGPNWSNQTNVPVGLSDVIQVASGEYRSCALKSDGTVVCWGYSSFDVPVGLSDVSNIAVSDGGACALKSDGTVVCWDPSGNIQDYQVPTDIMFVGVARLPNGVCLLKSTGDLFCVNPDQIYHDVTQVSGGLNGDICMLHSDTTVTCTNTTPTTGLSQVVKVTDGGSHACALKSDGTVVCWGANEFGQSNVPSGLVNVVDISAGWYHTCALRSDNTISCWGNDSDGQSTIPNQFAPILVDHIISESPNLSLGYDHTCVLRSGTVMCSANSDGMISDAIQVSAGYRSTCILKTDGTVMCIGENTSPVGLHSVVQLSNEWGYACALKSDNTVECWGNNDYGQTDVPNDLGPVSAISAANDHVCALTTTNVIRCWGNNGSGQTTIPSNIFTDVVQVSAGSSFTCALSARGAVQCWGANYSGQTNVTANLSDAVTITSGAAHSCALRVNGEVVCWGSNSFGQRAIPYGLVDAVAVEVGTAHSCALKSNGQIVCWGRNDRSQVSFQNLLDIPQGITGTNVASYDQKRIGVASDHKCAIRSNGTVVCWGGDNALGQNNVPSGLSGVIQILVINGETCAVKSDGQLICWGFSWSASKPSFPIDSVLQISGFNHMNSQGTGIIPPISTMCVVRKDGSVVCWGNNQYGQTNVPSNVSDVKQVSVGANYVCALKNNGTVQCWGGAGYGETSVPSGLSGVTQITNTAGRTYARKSDGNVVSWGFYSNGSSNTTNILHINALSFIDNNGSIPNTFINNILDIDSAPNFDEYETSIDSTCVLKNDEMITCFNPTTGALEDDVPGDFQMSLSNVVFNNQSISSTKQWSPWFSPIYPEVCRINSDQSLTCGYLDDRTLYDTNGDGVLGDDGNGAHLFSIPIPITPYDSLLLTPSVFDFGQSVPRFCNSHYLAGYMYYHVNCGLDLWTDTTPLISGTFQQVQNGQYGGCVLSTTGDVQCWGDIATNMPPGLGNVLQVAVSESHPASACIIRSDHTVLCWGGSSYGNGTDLSSAFHDIVQITNLHHLCGLRSDGGVICEDGNSVASVVPGTSSITNLAGTHWSSPGVSSSNDVCAIQQPNSRLVCWQYNVSGPPTVDSNIPAIADVSKFDIGYQHGCVVKNNGTVECWGSNDHGQTAVPLGLSDVAEIAIVGGYQTCALKNNGDTMCWGLPGIIYSNTCPNGSGTCYRFDGLYE